MLSHGLPDNQSVASCPPTCYKSIFKTWLFQQVVQQVCKWQVATSLILKGLLQQVAMKLLQWLVCNLLTSYKWLVKLTSCNTSVAFIAVYLNSYDMIRATHPAENTVKSKSTFIKTNKSRLTKTQHHSVTALPIPTQFILDKIVSYETSTWTEVI